MADLDTVISNLKSFYWENCFTCDYLKQCEETDDPLEFIRMPKHLAWDAIKLLEDYREKGKE